MISVLRAVAGRHFHGQRDGQPRFRTLIRAVQLIAAGAFFVSAAGAQNLAPNGEFDVDVSTWFTSPADAQLNWLPDDHSGCPAGISGAAAASNGASSADQGLGYGVCVRFTQAGETYSFGSDLRFPSAQASTGTATLSVIWLDSDDCSGFTRFQPVAAGVLSTDAGDGWTHVANDLVVAPADTNSASLFVRLVKNEAGGQLVVDIDGAYFVRGSGYIFGDGFERQSICHWSATSG